LRYSHHIKSSGLISKSISTGLQGEIQMNSSNDIAKAAKPAVETDANTKALDQGGHPLSAAIQQKWSKLESADLTDIKNREDLSTKIQSRYGISADQAAAQVKEWAVGRQF
jgi:hypothetical protein